MLGRLSKLLLPLMAGLACLAGSTMLRAADPVALQIVRERVFDLYQRVNPRTIGQEAPVRIIDIDDATLAAYGQWPLPRNTMATLVTTLQEAGAAAIALDMIFPEPDRNNPSSWAEQLNLPYDLNQQVQAELANLPSLDETFAAALRAAPTVLGVAIAPSGQPFTASGGLAMVGPDPTDLLTQSPSTINSLPLLSDAADGLGGIHVSARDEDAVVRRIPALTHIGNHDDGTILPGLFIEALRVAQGAQSLVIRSNPAPYDRQTGIPQDVRVGTFIVPLTRTGSYRLLYGNLADDITLSAQTVLAASDNPSSLSPLVGGTIALVGTSAPGLFDLRATPLGTIVPGVTMHAQAIASITSGFNLTRPDWARGLELMLILVAGTIVIAAAFATKPLIAALVTTSLVGALGTGSWLTFADQLMLVDASAPILSTLLVYGAVSIPLFVGVDRQQRFIRNAFALYLAEPVLQRLEANPNALALEGSKRTMTVLFMDVRGFTTRSEHMSPTQAVDLLNTLLEPLSEAVLAQEGTIDKFMGDGMMAFWNAPLDQPDHAARALYAADAMLDAIHHHNQNQPAEQEPLAIGIGIHTGEAFVGNMGSKRRFAYSAIGDSVNLAARVESLSGSLGHPLLITEATLLAAKNIDPEITASFVGVGDHSVKGRAQTVTLYAREVNREGPA